MMNEQEICRALETFAPKRPEFFNEPEKCLDYIQERINENRRLRDAIRRIMGQDDLSPWL